MRNVLFFVLMLSTIVLISAHAKKNRKDNLIHSTKETASYVEDIKDIGLKMIYVKGGPFIIGNTFETGGCSDERPITEIYLEPYYIGAYEITQTQWEIIMNSGIEIEESGNYPITNVSWNDAVLFCDKLSQLTGKKYQLPTEEQWEYAALVGETKNKRYSGGGNIDNLAWYSLNSEGEVHPVGLKRPNKFGIYDMSGNICEWCVDNYISYTRKYNIEKKKDIGNYRVLRGGSWGDIASNCRATYRGFEVLSCTSNKIGFRVVCIP